MQVIINIPDEFVADWNKDRFDDALHRLSADAHLIAGNYEQETAKMLADAFKNAAQPDPDTVSKQCGEWLPEYGDANARAYYCSACKFYYTTSPEQMNYCPHCGDPKKKMPPLKVRSSKQTVIERWQKVFERRHTYCKDCDRSIYGKYADCNTNIENNGLYVRGNCECRFKVKKEREETDTFS